MARKYTKITPGRKIKQVKGRRRSNAPIGYRGKKPNARTDNAAPLMGPKQIAHKRNRVILTDQRRVAKPSSRVSPPAQHHAAIEPSTQMVYPLYSKGRHVGECTVVEIRKSTIARGGHVRYRVAINGKVVGMASRSGDRMNLIRGLR